MPCINKLIFRTKLKHIFGHIIISISISIFLLVFYYYFYFFNFFLLCFFFAVLHYVARILKPKGNISITIQ